MQTFLLVSSDKKFIKKAASDMVSKLGVSNYNLHQIFPDPSIGIGQVRKITQLITVKTYAGGNRLIIINDMGKATTEAQNALLKILEEPPLGTYFLLTVDNADRLLPTIISRSQIISTRLKDDNENSPVAKISDMINQVIASSEGDRLIISAFWAKSKEDTIILMDNIVSALENNMQQNANTIPLSRSDTALLIRKVLAAREYINRNVNYKTTLDLLFLGFPNK